MHRVLARPDVPHQPEEHAVRLVEVDDAVDEHQQRAGERVVDDADQEQRVRARRARRRSARRTTIQMLTSAPRNAATGATSACPSTTGSVTSAITAASAAPLEMPTRCGSASGFRKQRLQRGAGDGERAADDRREQHARDAGAKEDHGVGIHAGAAREARAANRAAPDRARPPRARSRAAAPSRRPFTRARRPQVRCGERHRSEPIRVQHARAAPRAPSASRGPGRSASKERNG